MNKIITAGLSCAVAFAALILSGCTTYQVGETVYDLRDANREQRKLRVRLRRLDKRARKDIDKASDASDNAANRYYAAARQLAEKELPPDTVRPTQNEVDKLKDEAVAQRNNWWKTINDQIDAYDKFLEKYPNHWYVRHRFAWFLADMNIRYPAADEWERVIKDEPNFPYAYNNLGSLYNHMGRDKEAIVLFRKAIELHDSDPIFWVNLAVNYFTHRAEAMELYGWNLPQTFDECIKAYQRALALAPKDDTIARDIATQYIMAKHFKVTNTSDDALKAWHYYLSLKLDDDQRLFAYLNIGRIYLREKKDPATAIVWLEKGAAIDPYHTSIEALLKIARKELQK